MAFQSHIQLCCLSLIAFYILLATPCAIALNFNISQIGPRNLNVDITIKGDAYISSEGIHLAVDENTTNLKQKAGRATYIKPLHLWDKVSDKLADFTSHFSFVIDSNRSTNFGDGLAFFLEPFNSSCTAGIIAGGAIGLPIDLLTLVPTSQFVAVEFDTYRNSWDPQNIATHLGININTITSNVTRVWRNNIIQGIENEAVISYQSESRTLNAAVTSSINNAIVKQDISFTVDLRGYLSEWVTFGFSASTGASFEKNVVKSWAFNSSFQI